MDKNSVKQLLDILIQYEDKLINDGEYSNSPSFHNDFENILKKIDEEISNDNSNVLKIKIKKLSPIAVIPTYSKYGDAGMDLTAIEVQFTTDYIGYKTGLALEIPKGYVGLIFPRSSNSKKDLLLSNSVGVIDSGYRGEIEVRYKIIKDEKPKIYELMDRVGQIIIIPYPQIKFIESDELSDSERGEGGFGSTGA